MDLYDFLITVNLIFGIMTITAFGLITKFAIDSLLREEKNDDQLTDR